MAPSLDEDTIDDVLYFARTADVTELLSLLDELARSQSASPLSIVAAAQDTHTHNTALHYAAANGHTDVLLSLLGLDGTEESRKGKTNALGTAKALVAQVNNAGNTPLHYAALNGQLEACKLLLLAQLPQFDAVSFQKSESGLLREDARDSDEALKIGINALSKDESARRELIDALAAKNSAGRDAAGEAEAAEKDEVVGWLLAIMDKLEDGTDATDEAETPTAGECSDEITISAGETDDSVAEGVNKMKVAD